MRITIIFLGALCGTSFSDVISYVYCDSVVNKVLYERFIPNKNDVLNKDETLRAKGLVLITKSSFVYFTQDWRNVEIRSRVGKIYKMDNLKYVNTKSFAHPEFTGDLILDSDTVSISNIAYIKGVENGSKYGHILSQTLLSGLAISLIFFGVEGLQYLVTKDFDYRRPFFYAAIPAIAYGITSYPGKELYEMKFSLNF